MVDGIPLNAQLRLEESEERYRAVIEDASDMIQSVRPDGSFEFVNDAWRNTLGFTDDDLATMTIFEVIDPDFMEHCMADFTRAINGETVDFLETRFLTSDGRSVPVEGSVASRFLGDEVVATHGFFRDIWERLRARELEERTARLELEERARYLEKMAALGKLSAGLAHELNNPTSAMQRAGAGLKEASHRRDAAMLQLATSGLKPEAWPAMNEILARFQPDRRSPIALTILEADIETWLIDRGVERAWQFAPACAEAGISVEDLEKLSHLWPPTALVEAIKWMTESLMLRESTIIIADCCHRIADLVQAIKGYSHMDRASEYEADIHEGLENTLLIRRHRLQSINVHRQYDTEIPLIRMYGNSLNQVWTNILDNAIDAWTGKGRSRFGPRLMPLMSLSKSRTAVPGFRRTPFPAYLSRSSP